MLVLSGYFLLNGGGEILSRSVCWKPLVLLSQHHQLDLVELLFDKGQKLI